MKRRAVCALLLALSLLAAPAAMAGLDDWLVPWDQGTEATGTTLHDGTWQGIGADGKAVPQGEKYAYDFIMDKGTPIYAPCSGEMREYKANWTSGNGYGNHIKYVADDYPDELVIMAHFNSLDEALVKRFQSGDNRIYAGELLGYVGNTGTGPMHLHFEITAMKGDIDGVFGHTNAAIEAGISGTIDTTPQIDECYASPGTIIPGSQANIIVVTSGSVDYVALTDENNQLLSSLETATEKRGPQNVWVLPTGPADGVYGKGYIATAYSGYTSVQAKTQVLFDQTITNVTVTTTDIDADVSNPFSQGPTSPKIAAPSVDAQIAITDALVEATVPSAPSILYTSASPPVAQAGQTIVISAETSGNVDRVVLLNEETSKALADRQVGQNQSSDGPGPNGGLMWRVNFKARGSARRTLYFRAYSGENYAEMPVELGVVGYAANTAQGGGEGGRHTGQSGAQFDQYGNIVTTDGHLIATDSRYTTNKDPALFTSSHGSGYSSSGGYASWGFTKSGGGASSAAGGTMDGWEGAYRMQMNDGSFVEFGYPTANGERFKDENGNYVLMPISNSLLNQGLPYIYERNADGSMAVDAQGKLITKDNPYASK